MKHVKNCRCSQAMKKRIATLIATVLLIVALTGCAQEQTNGSENGNSLENVLFQYSTINALMLGLYDGEMMLKELKEHGTFGVGTINRIDGEMIILDGEFYQIDSEGELHLLDETTKTPFAVITDFDREKTTSFDHEMNMDQLTTYLDEEFTNENKNNFYAIKIEGIFEYVKARSVPEQKKPYPPLADVTANQPIFEFQNETGTLVGFWSPDYISGINVPGYHLHFITDDKSSGGHVLDLVVTDATVEVDSLTGFQIELPQHENFANANLTETEPEEVEKVEGDQD